MPEFYLDGLEEFHYVTPKSTDPDVIAERTRYPGLAIIKEQHVGIDTGRQALNFQFQDESERLRVSNWVGMAALLSSAHSFRYSQEHIQDEKGERRHDVLNRRLKPPVLAVDEADERWRQTEEGLKATVNEHFNLASEASAGWMTHHMAMIDHSRSSSPSEKRRAARHESRAVDFSLICARQLGAAALGLTGMGLTRVRDMSDAERIQRSFRQISVQTLSSAREAYKITGKVPSLAFLATADPMIVFPPLPKKPAEAYNALTQAQKNYEQ
jgi:hypothetical protein